ncbi:TPA: PBSX family phage terminase large subunit [Campylobacter jejuni]|nr:PBSX family phage terminase large subunit [Campylobacter jejuni]
MHEAIKIPQIYKVLFDTDYLFYVFYGGRGGGKSENVAISLVTLGATKKLRILCIRESQSSLAESVKSLLEKWIDRLNLSNFYKSTTSSIVGKNGTEFLFMGMRSHTAVNVKSVADINITWVEEAEAFSKRSWDLLVPSVIRTENPKIIITFNPYNEDDVIYKEFIANRPPENSFIKLINYYDNPFFEKTVLAKQRADDELRIPKSEYEHKWLGKLVQKSEDSLFKDANMEPLNELYLDKNYIRKIIACDPAVTNQHISNEYGIIILGKRADGTIDIIDDYSNNMSPLEFAQNVLKAKQVYNCNNVVVEVNNGGDFIKSTLLQLDPTLNVEEVRASSNKVQRAMPVANLMSISKVRLLQPLKKLERQMRLLTHRGFMGSRGESPDRLDACVWGVYHLADIRDKDSIYTVFEKNCFEIDKTFVTKGYIVTENYVYLNVIKDEYAAIVMDVYKYKSNYKIVIKDSFVVRDLEDLKQEIKNDFVISLIDTALTENLISKNFKISTLIEPIKENNLNNKVLNILTYVRLNKINILEDSVKRRYKNEYGNLLLLELMNYKYDDGKDYPLLSLLCDIIYTEFNISKD